MFLLVFLRKTVNSLYYFIANTYNPLNLDHYSMAVVPGPIFVANKITRLEYHIYYFCQLLQYNYTVIRFAF